MNRSQIEHALWPIGWCMLITAALLGAPGGCDRIPPNQIQGYVEGEFVYVASPLAGQLKYLNVQRGHQVKAGQALFALDLEPEQAKRDEAQRQVAQAQANLADLQKGSRPSEVASVDAKLAQAKAALVFSESEYNRLEAPARSGAVSIQEFERARSQRDQDRQRVAQYQADITTAKLGARTDQITAAVATVHVRQAALAQAQWDLLQKKQAAPQEGLVFDTLYRTGEWVAAGRPVVVLLPPHNIKVRAFVPEPRVGSLHMGDLVHVHVDGLDAQVTGKVSFISPQAEYTPPVIYNRQSRAKLVFMIEVVFDPKDAATLHPGQPVDVEINP